MRALFYGSVLALSVGFAALAQDAASQPVNPPSASAPPASDASATASTSTFKTGMVVKDSAGFTVGTIARVRKAADGTASVSIAVDGKMVNLPGASLSLSPSGKQAVSSMTKAEIKAAPRTPG